MRHVAGNTSMITLLKELQDILVPKKKKRKKFNVSILYDKKYEKKDFNYIVTKKERSKVAFLSGQERKTGQKLTYSKIDEISTVPTHSVGPGSYDSHKYITAISSNKIVSKLGVGGLATKAPRIKSENLSQAPDPGYYYKPSTYSCKQSKYPFDSALARKEPFAVSNLTPGLCSYDITKSRKRVIQQEHSFGSRVKLKPIVTIKCTPDNKDICSMCSKKPEGDYWITDDANKTPVCHHCYDTHNLYRNTSIIPNKIKYRKIRDCTDMHRHEGTTATIPLISEKEQKKQEIREAYLHNYTPAWIIKQIKPPAKKPKAIGKNVETDDATPDWISKDMAKLIDSFYKRTDAEYLQQRDISDERMREIFIPSRVVPNREQLMQHLLAEPEVYKFREYPKGRKMPLQKPEEEVHYEYEYQPVEYTIYDVFDDPEVLKKLEEQDWMKIVKCKTPGIDSDAELETNTEISEFGELEEEEEEEEQGTSSTSDELVGSEQKAKLKSESKETSAGKKLTITEEVAKIESLPELDKQLSVVSAKISNVAAKISENLEEYTLEAQRSSYLGVSESIEYGLEMIQRLFEPRPAYEPKADDERPVTETTEAVVVEKVVSSQVELELLQDPNIPPMPRSMDKHYEEMDRAEVDEDIRSLLDDSDIGSVDTRSLSQMTLGSFPGYPHLRP